jgi:hypothetical protein
MNISSVNSASAQWQSIAQSGSNQRAQDFQSLRSALQSGDLPGAQQAFANLQKNMQSSSQTASPANSTPSQTTPSSTVGKDFQALQSALQSGDLSGAQTAFATLKQDLQSLRATKGAHRHHHHHGGEAAGTTTQASAGAPTNGSTSNNSSAITSLLNTQA